MAWCGTLLKAAPEGVAMVLSKNGVGALAGLCKEYQISDRVKIQLGSLVKAMRNHKNELPQNKIGNDTSRSISLQKVELLSAQLSEAIKDLCYFDRISLDCEFFSNQGTEPEPDFASDAEELQFFQEYIEANDLAEKHVPSIADCARLVRARLLNVGKPGRPSVTQKQAGHIGCIAEIVMAEKLTPSHSGPFLEICTAVFQDAGFTFPDRALRYFMKHRRLELKASGYCL